MTDTRTQSRHMHDLFQIFGRVLIGSYFIAQSMGMGLAAGGMADLAAAGTGPLMLFWGSLALPFLAALALIAGFQTSIAAALLALHVVATSSIFNFEPGNAVASALFWKDAAMAGGLMMVMSAHCGTFGSDATRRGSASVQRSGGTADGIASA